MRKVQPQRRACGCQEIGWEGKHRVASVPWCIHHPEHNAKMYAAQRAAQAADEERIQRKLRRLELAKEESERKAS